MACNAIIFAFLTFLNVALFCDGHKKDYTGYATLSVGPLNSKDDAIVIEHLVSQHDEDRTVLKLHDRMLPGKSLDLVVAAEKLASVSTTLRGRGIPVDVVNEDLQKIIDEVDLLNSKARKDYRLRRSRNPESRDAPDFYMEYEEMEAWMVEIVGNTSDISVLTQIGDSYEGRALWAIEVNKDRTELPAIFVDSGIHAREHIAHATNVWIINEILLGTSDDAVRLRENFRWFLMPCVNPDGYDFTFNGDRLWRKNRQPNNGSVCIGTDLNRNWDAIGEGPSACSPNLQPCSDTYAGPFPFSGPETAALSNAFLEREGIELSLALHCYSQLWLIPWGGLTEKPEDYDDLLAVAEATVEAIEAVNGLPFAPGTPVDFFGCAAGGSFDWVKNGNPPAYPGTGAAVKYAYGPELRPASQAEGGFIIPPENIYPSGQEIFAGLVASVDAIFPPNTK